MNAAEVARFMAAYAKNYGAGAFGSPLASELAAHPHRVWEWTSGSARTVAVVRHLDRPARRREFTGEVYRLPAGAVVVTALARTPGAPVPPLDAADFIYGPIEDVELRDGLDFQLREVAAVNVTAQGQLIACWGRYGSGVLYDPVDVLTLSEVPASFGPGLFAAAVAEARGLAGWHDDYPYYSDGSWSALSLRGYRPDPRWGVKPSEMGRRWNAEHPEAAAYTCDWTELAPACPALVELAERVAEGSAMQRVRVLRMTGRAGGKGGRLARHSDITDRDHGTRDGQVARLHLPLVTHPSIVLHAWELDGRHRIAHLREGRVSYLDARKPHAVDNPTGLARLHLVVDLIVGPELRDRLLGHRVRDVTDVALPQGGPL